MTTGASSMPPYFALGYHQSRWSYYSADDVSNINFRFDYYEVPFDVIWLDIDVRKLHNLKRLIVLFSAPMSMNSSHGIKIDFQIEAWIT